MSIPTRDRDQQQQVLDEAGFVEACRHQSLLIAGATDEAERQEWLMKVADTDGWCCGND